MAFSNAVGALKRSLNSVTRLIAPYAFSILPISLRNHVQGTKIDTKQLLATSYLDGFRGLLSVMVYIRHFCMPFQEELDRAYGANNRFGILRLPPLRLIFASPSVPIFFVISGFVMSLPFLNAAASRDWETLSRRATKKIFRRAWRLMLPPAVCTLLVAFAVRANLLALEDDLPGYLLQPDRKASLSAQLYDWLSSLNSMTTPFRWEPQRIAYGSHLWTIPIQFRGSLIVVLFWLGFAETKRVVRVSWAVLAFVYCLAEYRFDVALHISGALLCEVYHWSDTRPVQLANGHVGLHDEPEEEVLLNDLDTEEERTLPPAQSIAWQSPPRLEQTGSWLLWILNLLLALYLACFPRLVDGEMIPGYGWLTRISSFPHSWQAIAGAQLVWAVNTSPRLQRTFEIPVLQYLGAVSFSLYIVHMPVILILGLRAVRLMWLLTGKESQWQYQLGFCLGVILTFPALLLAADWFQRGVQRPCERLSLWVEQRCLAQM